MGSSTSFLIIDGELIIMSNIISVAVKDKLSSWSQPWEYYQCCCQSHSILAPQHWQYYQCCCRSHFILAPQPWQYYQCCCRSHSILAPQPWQYYQCCCQSHSIFTEPAFPKWVLSNTWKGETIKSSKMSSPFSYRI